MYSIYNIVINSIFFVCVCVYLMCQVNRVCVWLSTQHVCEFVIIAGRGENFVCTAVHPCLYSCLYVKRVHYYYYPLFIGFWKCFYRNTVYRLTVLSLHLFNNIHMTMKAILKKTIHDM